MEPYTCLAFWGSPCVSRVSLTDDSDHVINDNWSSSRVYHSGDGIDFENIERQHDPIAAIPESVQMVGTAIMVSGIATFFGFSALCLVSFPIISNFGIETLIAVGFSLLDAIFIMPAVLSIMGQFTAWLDARKYKSAE